MSDKNITFLFGAGAECGKLDFGMINGFDYMKSSLFPEDSDNALNAVKEYFDKAQNSDFAFSKHKLQPDKSMLKNFIVYKIIKDNRDNKSLQWVENFKEIICRILNDDDFEYLKSEGVQTTAEFVHTANHKGDKCDNIDKDVQNIVKEFKKCLTDKEKKYSSIKCCDKGDCGNDKNLLQNIFTQGENDKIDFEINIGLGGLLDSYFHTIINPKKYGSQRFSKIFNYYWTCYFVILNGVLKFLSQNDKEKYKEYYYEGKLNYKNILNNLSELTRLIYSSEIKSDKSYYQLIKNKLDAINNCKAYTYKLKGIATTNYFCFCEKIFGLTSCHDENEQCEIVYLNGQLKLFEIPEKLEVFEALKDSCQSKEICQNDSGFFPFIFGPSKIKPIVHSQQVEHYHQFGKMLKDTQILVVLGFNLNEDDNHINSYIHEFIEKGGRAIIVTDKDGQGNAHKKLKCQKEQIEYCIIEYNQNEAAIDKLFKQILGD